MSTNHCGGSLLKFVATWWYPPHAFGESRKKFGGGGAALTLGLPFVATRFCFFFLVAKKSR